MKYFIFQEFDDMAATSYAKNVQEQTKIDESTISGTTTNVEADTGTSAGGGKGKGTSDVSGFNFNNESRSANASVNISSNATAIVQEQKTAGTYEKSFIEVFIT